MAYVQPPPPTLETILARGSVYDLLHDFGAIVKKSDIKEGSFFRQDVLEGLPLEGPEITTLMTDPALTGDEDDFLNLIIPDVGGAFIPDVNTVKPADLIDNNFQIGKDKTRDDYYANVQRIINLNFATIAADLITRGLPQEQPQEPDQNGSLRIKTVTGADYVITQSVVIDKKKGLVGRILGDKYIYKDPYKVFESVLGIKNNSAFVVDFAAISLPDFLTAESSSGSPEAQEKLKLYFITNPETENDAAGKTSPTSDCYVNIKEEQVKNGILLYSLQQAKTATNITNYRWGNLALDYENFFTNYNFGISDLIEVRDNKKIKKSTNLTISTRAADARIPPELITDSGNASNITFVKTSIAQRIKNFFKFKKLENPADNFFVNSKFQHKRSGDWLQALSCLTAKQRSYDVLNKNSEKTVVVDGGSLSNVYFVTHDRIAAGIALLLGVKGIIYTHAATSSYYVFRSADIVDSPEELAAKRVNRINKLWEVSEKNNKLPFPIPNPNPADVLDATIKAYNDTIDDLTRLLQDKKNTIIQSLQTIIQSLQGSIANPNNNKEKEIETNLKKLFVALNNYVFFSSNYAKNNFNKDNFQQNLNDYATKKNLADVLIGQYPTVNLAGPGPGIYDDVSAEQTLEGYNVIHNKIYTEIADLLNNSTQAKIDVVSGIVAKLNADADAIDINRIVGDIEYKKIMAKWKMDEFTGTFRVTSREQQTIPYYQNKLSTMKYKKPLNIFWTETLNFLSDDEKYDIKTKVIDPIIAGLNIDTLFSAQADTNLKAKTVVWHKLMTELSILFKTGLDQAPPQLNVSNVLNEYMEYVKENDKYELLNNDIDVFLTSSALTGGHKRKRDDSPSQESLFEPRLKIMRHHKTRKSPRIETLHNTTQKNSQPKIHIIFPKSNKTRKIHGTRRKDIKKLIEQSLKQKRSTFLTKHRKNFQDPGSMTSSSVEGSPEAQAMSVEKVQAPAETPTPAELPTQAEKYLSEFQANPLSSTENIVNVLAATAELKEAEKNNEIITATTYSLLNYMLFYDYEPPVVITNQILHPFLPVFMLLEALYVTLSTIDIGNNAEVFNDFLNFFVVLKKISEKITFTSYENLHQLGLVIRYIFFNKDKTVLGFPVQESRRFFEITEMLTNAISGVIIYNDSLGRDAYVNNVDGNTDYIKMILLENIDNDDLTKDQIYFEISKLKKEIYKSRLDAQTLLNQFDIMRYGIMPHSEPQNRAGGKKNNNTRRRRGSKSKKTKNTRRRAKKSKPANSKPAKVTRRRRRRETKN